MGFIETIIAKAIANKKTIVLPEASDRRVVEAAATVLEQGIANVVLIGEKEKVLAVAQGLDLSKATIVDPLSDPRFEDYVNTLFELRKAKGMTIEKARQTMQDGNYFGVMMVKKEKEKEIMNGK